MEKSGTYENQQSVIILSPSMNFYINLLEILSRNRQYTRSKFRTQSSINLVLVRMQFSFKETVAINPCDKLQVPFTLREEAVLKRVTTTRCKIQLERSTTEILVLVRIEYLCV